MTQARPTRLMLLLLLVLAVALQQGCDIDACDTPGGALPGSTESGPTIVSLTPAITRMLIDMGKRDQIIGVSMHDDPSLDVAVVGAYDKPDIARIIRLKPDLVLTETPLGQSGKVPSLLSNRANEGLFALKIIPHSKSIADVERALIDAEVGLGAAVGDPESAEHARKLMSLRIEMIESVLNNIERPRVLMLINPTTLGAIGTGVTHDEMLQLSGGANALSHVRVGYLTLDRAQLQQTVRPDVVLILEPNGVELSDGDVRLRPFEGLSIPVTSNRRFAVIQHPHVLLPSTALPEVMLEMALVLHPDRAAELREAYGTAEVIMQQLQAKQAEDGDGS